MTKRTSRIAVMIAYYVALRREIDMETIAERAGYKNIAPVATMLSRWGVRTDEERRIWPSRGNLIKTWNRITGDQQSIIMELLGLTVDELLKKNRIVGDRYAIRIEEVR